MAPRFPDTLARRFALAHYIERLIDAGKLRNYAQAAAVLGVTRWDGTIRIWNVREGSSNVLGSVDGRWVTSIAWCHGDTRLALASNADTIGVDDGVKSCLPQVVTEHHGTLNGRTAAGLAIWLRYAVCRRAGDAGGCDRGRGRDRRRVRGRGAWCRAGAMTDGWQRADFNPVTTLHPSDCVWFVMLQGPRTSRMSSAADSN